MSKWTKGQLHKERALLFKRKLSSWKYSVFEATIASYKQTYRENIYIGIAETIFKEI